MADSSSYGGFWIRTLAYGVDVAILTLGMLALATQIVFMGDAGTMLFGLIAAIGPLAYFAGLTASGRQATLGKQLCGLKVQHAGSGERVSLLRSIARELAKFVSAAILFIGFLLAAFTQRKQGLHDSLASTVVVREGTARIGLAIFVTIAGAVIPLIVVPLMFGALFAWLMMAVMGGSLGEAEVKPSKPVPRLEQKATPVPAATAAPAPKPATLDELETVLRNYHKAALASDLDELLKWSIKSSRDGFANASAAQREQAIAFAARSTPKTYKVTGSIIEPNGTDATLYSNAEVTDQGKTETLYGSTVFVKEEGAWKVSASGWGRVQSPAAAALQAAAVAPTAAPAPKPAPADEMEIVYRNFHAAALAGDLDELRKWGMKEKGDELAKAPMLERKMTVGLMAKLMPKTYTVTGREISADGNKAILRLVTGQPEKDKTDLGRGSAILFKEGGAWKVDQSIWGSGQPPTLASQSAPAKPAAAEPPKPMAAEPPRPMAVEAPKPVAVAAPEVKPAPAPAAKTRSAPSRSESPAVKPATPVLQSGKPPCIYKPVMTDDDIRNCR